MMGRSATIVKKLKAKIISIDMRNSNLISVPELCILIKEIIESRPDIGLRFRMLGEMWGNNFIRAAFVKGKSGIFKDEQTGKLITVHDLSNVMQFELDHSFHGFQPYFHYEVKPLAEFRQYAVTETQ